MQIKQSTIIVLLLLCLAPAYAAGPITVTDARGKKITLAHPPARIISLAPSVTEMLFAIGAGARVVGDTVYCHYPAPAEHVAKIGDYLNPNQEKIAALKPDLIIGARGNSLDALGKLEAGGCPVFVVDPSDLAGVRRDIAAIGDVVGCTPTARKLAAQLAKREAAVQTKTHALTEAQRPRTLFVFTPVTDLFSAGPGSHIDELIRLAGGRNVAGQAGKPWPQLSLERVVAADPQVILTVANRGEKGALTTPQFLAQLRADTRWRNLSAVKHGRVAVLDDDPITRPGPRLVQGLEAMAAALHPELFKGKARK